MELLVASGWRPNRTETPEALFFTYHHILIPSKNEVRIEERLGCLCINKSYHTRRLVRGRDFFISYLPVPISVIPNATI